MSITITRKTHKNSEILLKPIEDWEIKNEIMLETDAFPSIRMGEGFSMIDSLGMYTIDVIGVRGSDEFEFTIRLLVIADFQERGIKWPMTVNDCEINCVEALNELNERLSQLEKKEGKDGL